MGKMVSAFAETQIIHFLMLPYFYCLSGIGGCNAFCDYLFREGATLKTVVTPLSRSP